MLLKYHIVWLVSGILSMALMLSTPVQAENAALQDLIQILKDKGSISQEEYKVLSSAIKADAEKSSNAVAEIKSDLEKTTKNIPKVTTKGKLKFESQDGQYSFQPIGRIFWDMLLADNDDVAAIHDGVELRRARLGFQAQLAKYWQLKLEYDFADATAKLKDGWVAFNSKTPWGDKYYVKIGNHHVPFGFNTISSSKYISFLRRPLFADGTLSPSREAGVAVRVDNKRWLVHAGFFIGDSDNDEYNRDGDSDKTLAVRVAGTPLYQDNTHLLHVGASYMYKNTDQQGNTVRIRQRAITHLDDRLFDTGNLEVDSVNAFDMEALGIYGPFHVLGEYVNWNLDSDPNPNGEAEQLSAWSIEAGWFITGESMKYKAGQFSEVSPKRQFLQDGFGAWQLVARYENMDLNDENTNGGDGDVFTVGLNWIPANNIRFMLAYNQLLDFQRPGELGHDSEPSSLSLRSLLYW